MIRAAALLACLLLAACGQKGDLYMPDEATPVAIPATATTPASASADDKEQDEAQRQRQQQGAAGNAAGN
jgi:predicted small lipoprotein YifL